MSDVHHGPSRRTLLKGGAALAMSAASYRRVLGANERVGLGFIGFGLIGKRHVLDFKANPDANLVAIAEVHQGRLDEAAATMGGSPRKYGDFRRLLDEKDVDAVVVSTPDHWHALMTMMACAAGKDVYVEKPLSLFVREGRWMVDVARRHKRVVQVGTQQRSGPHYQKARDLVRGGHIGQVVSVRMWSYRNIMPGFGSPPDADPPPGFDYDALARPRPEAALQPEPGALPFPLALGLLGRPDDEPRVSTRSTSSTGSSGRRHRRPSPARAGGSPSETTARRPTRRMPCSSTTAGLASWSLREASRGNPPPSGLEFCGTKGSLTISRKGFVVTPDAEVARRGGRPPVRRRPPGRRPRRHRRPRLDP